MRMSGAALERPPRMIGAQVIDLLEGTFGGTVLYRRKIFTPGQSNPTLYTTTGTLKGFASSYVDNLPVSSLLLTNGITTSPKGINSETSTAVPLPPYDKYATVKITHNNNVKIIWSERIGETLIVSSLKVPDF